MPLAMTVARHRDTRCPARETRPMPVSWSEEQAGAASFLAVVPPDAIVERIEGLRKAAGLSATFLPHITVKAQPNLETPEVWRPAVRRAVAVASPVRVTLGPVGWFGDDIMYLAVDSEIVQLHYTVLNAVEGVIEGERFEYEGDAYVPHLTLGATFAGEPIHQLQGLAAAAARCEWPSFMAYELVEFQRGSPGQVYQPHTRFAVGR